MNNATNAMLLTAPGMAAIAVIRLSGPKSAAIAQTLATGARTMKPGDFRHAILRHNEAVLDDALLLRVDDSTFEFHLHGGKAVISGVLEALTNLGAEILSAGAESAAEWAWPRATLLSREALSALRHTLTPSAVHLLAAQGKALPAMIQTLLNELDAGRPLWEIQSAIQWLLHRSTELAFLLVPPRVAIIGPPNAGKSTLANALLGRPASITSDAPGTTRDWVDATALFAAGEVRVAVTLVDTAGVRETSDPIETESIRRSLSQAAEADLILVVLDAGQEPGDLGWLVPMERSARRMVIVWNKCDVAKAIIRPLPIMRRAVEISAKLHLHLGDLMRAALQELGVAEVGTECFAFSPRQHSLLQAAAVSTPAELQSCLRAVLTDQGSAP